MGLLADWQIRKEITITPFAEGVKRHREISYGLSSYGYDARLGRRFKVFTNVPGGIIVDPKSVDESYFQTYEVLPSAASYFILPAHSYTLAETVEWFSIPRDITAVCHGKSSYARVGLFIPVTPLEAQWHGRVTLELPNPLPLPLKVYIGEGIVQFQFHRADAAPCKESYADKHGKYQDDNGLTLAKVD